MVGAQAAGAAKEHSTSTIIAVTKSQHFVTKSQQNPLLHRLDCRKTYQAVTALDLFPEDGQHIFLACGRVGLSLAQAWRGL
jgi:hypothetical protein